MLLVVLLVRTLTPNGGDAPVGNIAMLVYNEAPTDSDYKKLEGALLNALVFVAFVTAATFLLVLLFYYRCTKCLKAYMGFSAFMVLAYMGGGLSILIIQTFSIPIDVVTFSIILFNFTVVGVLSVFFGWMPILFTQGYLVMIGMFVAFWFSMLPEWTTWVLLVAMAIYDVVAVLVPGGPLNILVELAMSREEELPALIYEARPISASPSSRRIVVHNSLDMETSENVVQTLEPPVQQMRTWRRRRPEDRSGSLFDRLGISTGVSSHHGFATDPANLNHDSAERRSPTATGDQAATIGPGVHVDSSLDNGRAHLQTPREDPQHTQSGLGCDSETRERKGYSNEVRSLQDLMSIQLDVESEDTPTISQGSQNLDESLSLETDRLLPEVFESSTAQASTSFRSSSTESAPVVLGNSEVRADGFHLDVNGSQEYEADQDDFGVGLTSGIKLGLGDFIFYSVLVGRAAMFDLMTVYACYLAIIAGLGTTLILLAVYRRALPALPVSISLGVIFYFLTRLVLDPFIVQLSTNLVFF
ncbi:hypothetical protein O6H91_17G010200 [Diphasiastrum complanatum]|nr:hypothetical protein O6H91_17G010200 [Diphasiastrum complanatum]